MMHGPTNINFPKTFGGIVSYIILKKLEKKFCNTSNITNTTLYKNIHFIESETAQNI